MKDLKISYDNENGDRIETLYNTIMDFIDLMNLDTLDIPMLDYENVDAIFFENELNKKHFETINDLLEHCIAITQ
jgi:hypothetical protein